MEMLRQYLLLSADGRNLAIMIQCGFLMNEIFKVLKAFIITHPYTVEPCSRDMHPYITDSFVCPDRKKAHIFSAKLTRLIRTLWHVPSMSALTGSHCSNLM